MRNVGGAVPQGVCFALIMPHSVLGFAPWARDKAPVHFQKGARKMLGYLLIILVAIIYHE